MKAHLVQDNVELAPKIDEKCLFISAISFLRFNNSVAKPALRAFRSSLSAKRASAFVAAAMSHSASRSRAFRSMLSRLAS